MIILSNRNSLSLDFLINPCGNDIWTYYPFYYLYDLCTCSDLDQIEFLVYYPKQKVEKHFYS